MISFPLWTRVEGQTPTCRFSCPDTRPLRPVLHSFGSPASPLCGRRVAVGSQVDTSWLWRSFPPFDDVTLDPSWPQILIIWYKEKASWFQYKERIISYHHPGDFSANCSLHCLRCATPILSGSISCASSNFLLNKKMVELPGDEKFDLLIWLEVTVSTISRVTFSPSQKGHQELPGWYFDPIFLWVNNDEAPSETLRTSQKLDCCF